MHEIWEQGLNWRKRLKRIIDLVDTPRDYGETGDVLVMDASGRRLEWGKALIGGAGYDHIILMSEDSWTLYPSTTAGLTAALAAAESGDAVWVPAGTYAADYTVGAGVVVIGVSDQATIISGTVTLGGDGAGLYGCGWSETFNDVNTHTAIQILSEGDYYIDRCRVHFDQNGGGGTRGVYISSAAFVHITRCHIECNGHNGKAVSVAPDTSGGAELVVTDGTTGATITEGVEYDVVDESTGGLWSPTARIGWNFHCATSSPDYAYFRYTWYAYVRCDTYWGDNSTPIGATFEVSHWVNGENDNTQYFDEATQTWKTATVTLGTTLTDEVGALVEGGVCYMRLRRDDLYDHRITAGPWARIARSLTAGIAIVKAKWQGGIQPSGLWISYSYLYGSLYDIDAATANIYLQAVTYRPGDSLCSPVPDEGDRAAWDVDDYAELHASDIDAGALQRHLPLPGADGGLVRSDGTDWQRVNALAASEITNTPAGNIVATDVQAAINELDTEKLAPANIDTLAELNAILTDATLDDVSGARTPTAHASTHKHGGSDEVGTATPAANAIPKADSAGYLDAWVSAASAIVAGKVELATTDETKTGTDTERAVTPAGLAGALLDMLIDKGIGEHLFTIDDGLLLLGPYTLQRLTAWESTRWKTAKIDGAFHQVQGPWANSRALVVEDGTTNLITNPSFETGTTGWTSSWSDTLAQSSKQALYGSYSLKITGNGTAGTGAMIAITVVASTVYTASMWFYVPSDWNGSNPSLRVYENGYVTMLGASSAVTEREKWVRRTVTFTPSLTTVRVIAYDTGSATTSMYIDGVQLEENAVATSYCDGSLGTGYAWTGTPHASPSTRAATAVGLDSHASMFSGQNTLTHSVWVQAAYDSDATWPSIQACVLDYRGADNNNRVLLEYRDATDKLVLYINGSDRVLSDALTFSAGDWLYIVCTLDFTNDSYKLYLNGELVNTSTATLTAPTAIVNWVLGTIYSTGTNFGGWAFGEYAVFGRALTAEEVAALYARSKPLADAGALALPVDNNGPLAASWQVLGSSNAFSHNSSTFVDIGGAVFEWGTRVAGKLQLEVYGLVSSSGNQAEIKLQWNNAGSWTDVAGSTITLTSTTGEVGFSSRIILPYIQRTYKAVGRMSVGGGGADLFFVYRIAIVCNPDLLI